MDHTSQTYRITPLQIQPRYASRDAWEALAAQESLHYEVLELSVPPVLNDEAMSQEYKEWYLTGGRVTSVHGAFIDINPVSGDAAFRDLSRQRCRQSCALALALGARNVVFHSSCFPFLRDEYLDDWAGKCSAFYEELADTYPLRLFIENSSDIDPGPLKELMKRLPDPKVGICLDLGHANYSRACLEEWFDALHDRIGYLHLSDNTGAYDSHLPLGQGSVDWRTADRLWRTLPGPVPVTIETKTPEDTAASIAFLKKYCFFGR